MPLVRKQWMKLGVFACGKQKLGKQKLETFDGTGTFGRAGKSGARGTKIPVETAMIDFIGE